jgi:hypothetical protein
MGPSCGWGSYMELVVPGCREEAQLANIRRVIPYRTRVGQTGPEIRSNGWSLKSISARLIVTGSFVGPSLANF